MRTVYIHLSQSHRFQQHDDEMFTIIYTNDYLYQPTSSMYLLVVLRE